MHHQDGISERSIQTVVICASSMLLHAAIHWLDVADLQFWPFFLRHAVIVIMSSPNLIAKFPILNWFLAIIFKIIQIFNACICGAIWNLLRSSGTGQEEASWMVSSVPIGCFHGIFSAEFPSDDESWVETATSRYYYTKGSPKNLIEYIQEYLLMGWWSSGCLKGIR